MKFSLLTLMYIFLYALIPTLSSAQEHSPLQYSCGGDLSQWRQNLENEAKSAGISDHAIQQLAKAKIDQRVVARDRSQTIFNLSFADFSKKILSHARFEKGKEQLKRNQNLFQSADETYGVPGAVITAIWGLETDYGAIQGNLNTLDALFTLSYDCRRPEVFRPQLIALLKLFDKGVINARSTGAWAGEIGQMQLLPKDYLEIGVDGDKDGKIDLKNSVPDAIMTAAHMLNKLGWHRGDPWLEPVLITRDISWQQTGRTFKKPRHQWLRAGIKPLGLHNQNYQGDASLLLPMGRHGPAFLAYDNFDIFLKWNKSSVYATTVAYFAARLDGDPAFVLDNPEPGLSTSELLELQKMLSERGYNIGKIDGILGAATRESVRQEQIILNMPADSWPTQELLAKLKDKQ